MVRDQAGGEALRWSTLAQSGLTLAIYMGVNEATSIEAGLLQGGLPPETPALLVQAASGEAERLIATRLAHLCSTIHAEQVASPCVMLIGQAMREDVPLWQVHRNLPSSDEAEHAQHPARQYAGV